LTALGTQSYTLIGQEVVSNGRVVAKWDVGVSPDLAQVERLVANGARTIILWLSYVLLVN